MLRFYRAPQVIGGDWNASPETISGSDFVERVDGHLVVSAPGSHRAAAAGKSTRLDSWLALPAAAAL
eukprot:9486288-Pyramimonas_sp.AAC.1